MLPYLTLYGVLERALALITEHPHFVDPLVLDANGAPVRINHIRLFGGVEVSNQVVGGLTLSLYPYTYQGTSNETTDTTNAGIVYDSAYIDKNGFEKMTINLIAKLTYRGPHTTTKQEVGVAPYKFVVERSTPETVLYKWGTLLRGILLSSPIDDLGGWVKNSTVTHLVPLSADWNKRKGENAVFHEVAVLWKLFSNAPRNYALEVSTRPPTEGGDPIRSWVYVGLRLWDGKPIYWDLDAFVLTTSAGFGLLTTPRNQRVVWNPAESVFEDLLGTDLTESELTDPRLPTGTPWIATYLLLIGTIWSLDEPPFNIYWNKNLLRIERWVSAGVMAVVTHLPDGTPITYDPETGEIINTNTGLPIDPKGPNDPTGVIGVNKGRVNFFEANSGKYRDRTWL